MNEPKTIPSIGVDAQCIAKRLEKAEVGEIIPYAELSEIIKRNVQGDGRGSMQTAINIMRREHQRIFKPIRGIGIKRLVAGEILDIGTDALASIGRKSRRASQQVKHAPYDQLTRDQKTAYNMQLSVLGVLAVVTKPKRLEALESKIAEAGDVIAVNKTLELFQSK